MGIFAALAVGLGIYLWLSGEDPKNPDITPEALDEITEIRVVQGMLVRFFKPVMYEPMMAVLYNNRLQPVPADQAVLPHGTVVYRVVGEPAGAQSAGAMVHALREQNAVILGTHMLPFPTKVGRYIATSLNHDALANAHPTTGWAVLFAHQPNDELPGTPYTGSV